jgi:hypothetical protein
LSKNKFNISLKRWDDSKKIPSSIELNNFMKELNEFRKHEVCIFFSPERIKFKSKVRETAITELEKRLKHQYSNVKFFNNYNLKYSDSMFVDCYHFNEIGAKEYTKLMWRQIEISL